MARIVLALATAVTFAAAASPAYAVDINLTTPTSSSTGYSVDTKVKGIGTISNIGDSLTYSVGTGAGAFNMTATAYSLNSSTGLINDAALNIYGKSTGYAADYGLGVQDQFESLTSPNHSVDNLGMIDFIVLQFDKAVNFTSFNLGWAYNDADTTVSWGNTVYGGLDLDGKSLSSISSSMLGSKNFDVNGTVLGSRDLTIPTVNTVVIYARQGSGADKNPDYIKINSVTATSAVPEPATWAMMLVGFGAIGYGMRRRKPLALSAA